MKKLKYSKEFYEFIASINSSKEAQTLLGALMTPAELDEFSQRIQIFKRLLAGDTQRKISKDLGVSLATVSRGSRELKYGKSGIAKKM